MSTCSRLTWLIFLSTLTCYVNKLTPYLINLLIATGSNEQTFELELRSGSKIGDVSGAQSHSVDEKCWKVGAIWAHFGTFSEEVVEKLGQFGFGFASTLKRRLLVRWVAAPYQIGIWLQSSERAPSAQQQSSQQNLLQQSFSSGGSSPWYSIITAAHGGAGSARGGKSQGRVYEMSSRQCKGMIRDRGGDVMLLAGAGEM